MLRLLYLSIPVAMAQLGFVTMGLIDLYTVRTLGSAATGAVGISSSFFGWAVTIGIGLLAGMDFLVSSAFGAGQLRDADKTLVQGLWLGVLLGIPLTIAMWFAADYLSFWEVKEDVAVLAAPFTKWLALSLMPCFVFAALRNYLQAISKPWPAFVILFLANVGNYFLNFALVYGYAPFPEMGVKGCAVATFAVRTLMAVVLAIWTFRERASVHGELPDWNWAQWKLQWPNLVPILKLGGPAAAYMMLEVGVFGLSTLLAARLESAALAAHQIVLNLAASTFMIPLGIGAATAVLVGQSIGKKDFAEARRTGWRGLLLSTLFMSGTAIAFIVFSTMCMAPFTSEARVLFIGAQILKVAALFQLADGAQTSLAGALRGVGNTHSAFYANLVGHWVVGLPLGLWLCFSLGWGVVGLWFGLALGLALVALALGVKWIQWRVVQY